MFGAMQTEGPSADQLGHSEKPSIVTSAKATIQNDRRIDQEVSPAFTGSRFRGDDTERSRVTSASTPAVEIERLSKRYGRTLALDAVSFAVPRGTVFALLGPNGAGKTTLLHILCTILRPDGGAARITGIDVVKSPLAARRNLGVVFQEPSLDDRLTVEENLEFHGLVYGVPRALRSRRIDEMLALVELDDCARRVWCARCRAA